MNQRLSFLSVWWRSYLQSRNHTEPHGTTQGRTTHNLLYSNKSIDDNHISLHKYIPIRTDMIVHNKWKGVVEEYGNMLNRTVVGWNPIRNNTHKLNGDWLWLENTLKDCLLLLCLGFSVAAFYLGLNFWKKKREI